MVFADRAAKICYREYAILKGLATFNQSFGDILGLSDPPILCLSSTLESIRNSSISSRGRAHSASEEKLSAVKSHQQRESKSPEHKRPRLRKSSVRVDAKPCEKPSGEQWKPSGGGP